MRGLGYNTTQEPDYITNHNPHIVQLVHHRLGGVHGRERPCPLLAVYTFFFFFFFLSLSLFLFIIHSRPSRPG